MSFEDYAGKSDVEPIVLTKFNFTSIQEIERMNSDLMWNPAGDPARLCYLLNHVAEVYIDTNYPYPIETPNSFTVEAWVRYIVLPSAGQFFTIFNSGNFDPAPAKGHGFFVRMTDDGKLRVGSFVDNFDFTVPYTLEAWHHIAATYNNSNRTYNLYFDGEHIGSHTMDQVIPDTGGKTRNLMIGYRDNFFEYLSAFVDEIRFWARERSAANIKAYFSRPLTDEYIAANTSTGDFLMGYWKCDFTSQSSTVTNEMFQSPIIPHGTLHNWIVNETHSVNLMRFSETEFFDDYVQVDKTDDKYSLFAGVKTDDINRNLPVSADSLGFDIYIPPTVIDDVRNLKFTVYQTPTKTFFKKWTIPSANLTSGWNRITAVVADADETSNEPCGKTPLPDGTGFFIASTDFTDESIPKSEMTLEMWMKFDTINFTTIIPFSVNGITAASQWEYYLYIILSGSAPFSHPHIQPNEIRVVAGRLPEVGSPDPWPWVSDAHDVSTLEGQWFHIAFVYGEDVGGLLYIDGNPIGSRVDAGIGALPTLVSSTLNRILGTSQIFSYVADLRLWRYQRSEAEINRDKGRRLTGNESGLYFHYPFSEGNGWFTRDTVSNTEIVTQNGFAPLKHLEWDFSFDQHLIQSVDFVAGAEIQVETEYATDTFEDVRMKNLVYYVFDENDTIFKYAKNDVILTGSASNHMYEGRVMKYGSISREMSGIRGIPNIGSLTIDLANNDLNITNNFAALGGAPGLKGKEVEISLGLITDASSPYEFTHDEFITIYRGIVDNISFTKLKAKFKIEDNTQKYFRELPTLKLLESDWIAIPEANQMKPAPIIYNAVTGPTGALPVIHVGDEGTNTDHYVIAGHACKDLTGQFFVDGIQQTGSTYSKEENSVVKTVDYAFHYQVAKNGKLFTVLTIDKWFNPETTEYDRIVNERDISVNITGKTYDGTKDGTVITDVMDALYDLFTKEIGIPDEELDEPSWNKTQGILQTRGQVIAGAIVESIGFDQLLSEICVSHNIDFYQTRDGKFAFDSFLPEMMDLDAPHYSDEYGIIEGTFEVDPGMDNLVNRIIYEFAYDYKEREFGRRRQREDFASIEQVGYPIDWEGGTLGMKWVRTPAVALAVVSRFLDRYSKGRQSAKFTAPLEFFNNEIADKVQITHYDAPTLKLFDKGGWDKHLSRIRHIGLNIDNFTVTVKVDNLFDLAVKCFFLGSMDIHASAFNDASVVDRQYGYLCDEVTGRFDDEDATEGYKLC